MSEKHFRMAVAIWLAACGACRAGGEPAVDTSNLQKIGVDFSLAERERCKRADRSPAVKLSAIPPGGVSYDVKMTDLDAPDFKHWAQTIDSNDGLIHANAGARAGYRGPACPANGHRYRISVLVRDRQHHPVAYGEKTVVAERAEGPQ
jgi:phosphatidylethanolamine-binding protein (PEBP) family uncharacterized protein